MKPTRRYLACTFAALNAGAAVAGILDDVRTADEKCDEVVASIRTADELKVNGGKPVPLVAKGWDCIAAAYSYAAEPHLFSDVRLVSPPPS